MTSKLQVIQTFLSRNVSPGESDLLLKPLEQLPLPSQKEVADAGLILSDFSTKAAIEYFRAAPEVLKSIHPAELAGWVGMGIKIATHSSASGIRYFREGATVFSKIPNRSARDSFIELGLSLAQQNPNLALEYYRQAPSFLGKIDPPEALHLWAQYGFELGAEDYTLAVEYFKITPSLLEHLPLTLLPQWVGVAKAFAAAKLFLAITFIRTSPEIFSKMSAGLSGPLLKTANQIALFDAEAAKDLFTNLPTVLREVERDVFLKWIDQGFTLLKQGKGKGYFTFESKAAIDAANQLKGGLFLSSCANVLQLFAEALCGREVKIKPAIDDPSGQPTTDGETIYLPPHIRLSENNQNFEWYKIATAFQTGYIEFGTFTPHPSKWADFIASFANPELIHRLFEIAEGARVEFLLRQEYPGLLPALVRMREWELAHRPLLAGLLPRQKVIELLHQISLSGKTKEPIPSEMVSTVFEACRVLGAVQVENATVDRSMTAAKTVYHLLYDALSPPEITGPMEPFEEKGEKARGKGAESGKARTATIRGGIDPSRVLKRFRGLLMKEIKGSPLVFSERGESLDPILLVENARDPAPKEKQEERAADPKETDRSAPSPNNRFLYDEWDCEADDYRPGFCRVVEKEPVSKGEDFAENVMAEYGGMIKSIRRALGYLAPEGVVWAKGEYEGEEIDLDRLMEHQVEVAASQSPGNRIYMRRRKKERSVASAFLIDISGSTQQRLPSGKSVLQVEKEALILLSHAIDAVGDRFALYGFSGRGNDLIDFCILKDFQAGYTREVDLCIGGVDPLWQNRDGAAIRHATSKLLEETAKTRILVLISDGKPMDDGYTGSYAVADTKKALREARQKGVHPFCITVDRAGAEYLPGMYGNVAYLVVDQIETLPAKLPQIYKRLTT